jgi:hypothetical protein
MVPKAGRAAMAAGLALAVEYVYALQGDTLHKLAADGLDSVKTVTLDFDAKNGN